MLRQRFCFSVFSCFCEYLYTAAYYKIAVPLSFRMFSSHLLTYILPAFSLIFSLIFSHVFSPIFLFYLHLLSLPSFSLIFPYLYFLQAISTQWNSTRSHTPSSPSPPPLPPLPRRRIRHNPHAPHLPRQPHLRRSLQLKSRRVMG